MRSRQDYTHNLGGATVMETLSEHDLSSLREFLRASAAPGSLSSFVTRLLPVINGLVPGDVVCYAQIDPVQEKVITQVTYASGSDAPCDREVFERYMMSHPIFEHWGKTGQSAAARTSDFLSRRQWHEYDLYQEFYREWRCEDSLAIGLPAPEGHVACFCIERAGSFTDRELTLMETVRPHLVNLYRNVEAFSLIRDAGSGAGSQWILLDAEGSPVFASHAAWDLLWEHFPEAVRREDALPEALAAWVRSRLQRFDSVHDVPPVDAPFVQRQPKGGSTLYVRMHSGPATGEQAALILRQSPANSDPPTAPDVCLTVREMEVLAYARDDLTAGEIADKLCISRRTVEKHLEHIYNKLGVYSRVGAVTRMFLP